LPEAFGFAGPARRFSMRPPASTASARIPAASSLAARAWFGFRAGGLRLLRGARNLRERGQAARLGRIPLGERSADASWPVTAGASRTALWNSRDPAEFRLTAGKVHNLRIAARKLDGLLIPAGGEFSFWRALGRPTRARGFVAGRELREGCLVASTGGGLCQLSNALYAAALQAGLPIVERHAHSKIVPGSLAERGLDATVFWNYLDLRFRAPADCLLRVELSSSHLSVRLLLRQPAREPMREARPAVAKSVAPSRLLLQPAGGAHVHDHAHDCLGCAQTACVEYIAPVAAQGQGAWLLDEAWPEFGAWLGEHARGGDTVCVPLDGARRKRAAYAWPLESLSQARIIEHLPVTLLRSLNSRLLASQGAARQRGLARMEAMLACAYARRLAPEMDRVTVSLNLLPHLWQNGVLAGRRVAVLLNRSPLALLHAQLDRAHALHPQSATLNDFRADPALLAAEHAALAAADCLVTPHLAVAHYCRAQFGDKVTQLPWQALPGREAATRATQNPATRGGAVLFPASALGRKGAYEVREACRELKLPVRVLGQASEHEGFWRGMDASPADARDPWAGVACVALPAFVEHRPRLLLAARSRGLAVVCSEDCGLADDAQGGVHTVRAGHLPELTAALARAAA
jgi:hypothetical protein